jgi:hypothetical protein
MKFKTLFISDPARRHGVRPINVLFLYLVYGLMAIMMAPTAWASILGHQGVWDPYRAMATCVWAAYGSLALLGLLHPLRMLPIVLFMIFYKSLWLAIVAWPLWRAGALAGSPAEELTFIFLAAPLFALGLPWGYVLRHVVWCGRLWPKPAGSAVPPSN